MVLQLVIVIKADFYVTVLESYWLEIIFMCMLQSWKKGEGMVNGEAEK